MASIHMTTVRKKKMTKKKWNSWEWILQDKEKNVEEKELDQRGEWESGEKNEK